jgi:segregation and condensation protein B
VNETTELTSEALMEALIFASPRPVLVDALASAAGLSDEEAQAALGRLETQLADRGLRLQRTRGRIQLVSAPEAAPYIEALLGLDVDLRLSQAAMETLAIVAYAQPVTRPQVESIRGVGSDSTLRTLLSAGLIEDLGRADTLGRPILYGTTFEFLQQFGLEEPGDLPPLEPSPESAGDDTEPPAEH